jgi:hypothetical protein
MAEEKRHDYDALWSQTVKHGDKISTLEQVTARIESHVTNQQAQMEQSFSALSTSLHNTTTTLNSAINNNKPAPLPYMQLSTLILGALVAFGSVIVYMTSNQGSTIMRESDLRFTAMEAKNIVSVNALTGGIKANHGEISNIKNAMAVDDLREQSDSKVMGDFLSDLANVEKAFTHLDGQIHIKDRRNQDMIINISSRLSAIERLQEYKHSTAYQKREGLNK